MNDDLNLLRPLRLTDLPPSRVDLGRAVAAGRRRERRRNLVIGTPAALATVVVVLATVLTVDRVATTSHTRPAGTDTSAGPSAASRPAPAAPPLGTCTFTDLTLPGTAPGSIGTTDPSGRIVVVPEDAGGTVFVRFVDGHPERITGVPAGGGSVSAVDRTGDFLGSSGAKTVYVYRGGKFHLVPLPDRAKALSPVGLDDRGDALVDVLTDGKGGVDSYAAVWPADQPASLKPLSMPAGWSARSTGMSANGTVAGTITMNGRSEPVVWTPDGTLRHLPVPAAAPNPLMMRSITGDWVVARYERWNLKTGAVDILTGIWGEKVDKYGRVYGEAPNIAPPHPAVWVNGTVTRLPADPARPLGMMGDVDEDGTRITSVLEADNPPNPRPVVWTCTP